MTMHRLVGLVVSLVVLSAPASAEDRDAAWYAGAAAGGLQTRFQPNYTFSTDGDPEQFFNRKSGWHVYVLAGRRVASTDRFSLALQGSAGFNRIAWTLSIPEEPAEFRYSLPYTVLASVAGATRVGQRASVFAEIGGGVGRVREIKTSPARSSYNVDALKGAWTAGGGLALPLAPRSDLVAAYRYVRYAAFEYDTFDPSGALVEHVEDRPSAHGVTVGVTMKF